MTRELNLRFIARDRLVVESGESRTEPIAFTLPLTVAELDEIRWYLETYGALYITEVDDARAERIVERLAEWGTKLFAAALATEQAREMFAAFTQSEGERRVITIRAGEAAILALPWELLCEPEGTFAIDAPLSLSIRRCFESSGEVTRPELRPPQSRLRVLFVVSRPVGVGWLDPRADALAVMEALEGLATDAIEVEFLRPATMRELVKRLKNPDLPPVDILHFDGHGKFDSETNTGYLQFAQVVAGRLVRNDVSAATLGKKLARANIPLVVLSACQSARVGKEDALGSTAIALLRAGVPSVLAMTHSVLAETARRLFGVFYRELARGEGIATALDRARLGLREDTWRGMRQRDRAEFALHLQDWFLPALYQAVADGPLLQPETATQQSERSLTPLETLPPAPIAGFWGRSQALWQIEQAFVLGARRVTVSGFGGQGKTVLAAEAGRWLVRAGLFDRACFVSFDSFQGVDPVEYAIARLNLALKALAD